VKEHVQVESAAKFLFENNYVDTVKAINNRNKSCSTGRSRESPPAVPEGKKNKNIALDVAELKKVGH